MEKNHKIYSIIFLISLLFFVLDYVLQGSIIFSYSDNYGLISKMRLPYWIGYIGMIILVYYHFINFERIDTKYVFLSLSLATIYLIGTPFFYESLPRFEDSWFHSFLAERMYKTGMISSTGNIYEQYPGSFLFYGLLFNFIPSYVFMKFFPVLFYLFGIIVIFLIFKELAGPKTSFIITIFYMFFDWTVEDNHISPQFLMLNLYLVFMLITIKLLKNQKNRKGLWVIIVMMALTFAFSHLFTQIFIISILAASFILTKELKLSIFPILVFFVAVFLLHEIFFTTVIKSFLTALIGMINSFSINSLFTGASSKIVNDQFSRKIIIGSRLAILFLSVVIGSIGIISMYKKKLRIEAKFIFAWAFCLIPFLIVVLFSIKGEFAERFALVSSLPLAVGAGFLFGSKKIGVLILAFLLILSPIYFMAKYGNESFESKSLQRLRADCFGMFFNLDCEKEMTLMHSPLNYHFEDLGKTHFTVTREEVIASSIYGNTGSVDDILELIQRIEDEGKLDRVYSTNDAWSYIRIQ